MLLMEAEQEKCNFVHQAIELKDVYGKKSKCKWGFLFCWLLYVNVVGQVSMGLNTCLWFSYEVFFS